MNEWTHGAWCLRLSGATSCLFTLPVSHDSFQQVFSLIVPTRTQDKHHTEERAYFFIISPWHPNSTFFWSGKEFLSIPNVSLSAFLSHTIVPFLFSSKVRSLADLCQNITFLSTLYCFQNPQNAVLFLFICLTLFLLSICFSFVHFDSYWEGEKRL